MASQSLHIVVVGGSITGLLAANTLGRLGHKITILERYAPSRLNDQGAGIRILADIKDLVESFGPHEDWYASYDGARDITAGTSTPVGGNATSWGKLWNVLRRRADAVPLVQYRSGCAVVGLEEESEGGKVKVTFTTTPEADAQAVQRDIIHADLVLGADGASSTVRRLFLPDLRREYCGYVAWRGLVPESALTPELKATFSNSVVTVFEEDFMAVSYTVPTESSLHGAGESSINWVFYQNCTDTERAEVLTDSAGVKHDITLPRGKARAEQIEKLRKKARDSTPDAFAQLIALTPDPFVQVVTDVLSPQRVFLNGKVVLLGDAVAGNRPHVACATSQAAFHVSRLADTLRGSISMEQWDRETGQLSQVLNDAARELGRILMTTEVPKGEKRGPFMQQILLSTKACQDAYARINGSRI